MKTPQVTSLFHHSALCLRCFDSMDGTRGCEVGLQATTYKNKKASTKLFARFFSWVYQHIFRYRSYWFCPVYTATSCCFFLVSGAPVFTQRFITPSPASPSKLPTWLYPSSVSDAGKLDTINKRPSANRVPATLGRPSAPRVGRPAFGPPRGPRLRVSGPPPDGLATLRGMGMTNELLRLEGSAAALGDMHRAASVVARLAAQRDAEDGYEGAKRRKLFSPISSKQRCGECKTCLNPSMKKACLVRRREQLVAVAKDLQTGGDGEGEGAAGQPGQASHVPPGMAQGGKHDRWSL